MAGFAPWRAVPEDSVPARRARFRVHLPKGNASPTDKRTGKRHLFIRHNKVGNELETTQTPTRKRRFPVTLVVILLLLAAGAVVVVNLFNQSLITAEQKHDHDGDGTADH